MSVEIGPTYTTVRAESVPREPAKTLRDEFAMAALTGLISTTTSKQCATEIRLGRNPVADIADVAYQFADAMLKARQKEVGE